MKIIHFPQHQPISGLSRQYPSAYPGLYTGPGYSYPTPPVVSTMSGMFPFPVPVSSMNTMHQMSPSDDGLGVSLASLTSPRPQERPASPVAGGSGGPWHSAVFEPGPLVKKHKRHHQQSRTIFRCVSGERNLWFYDRIVSNTDVYLLSSRFITLVLDRSFYFSNHRCQQKIF